MEPGRIVVQGITKVLCTGVFMAIVIASDTVEPLWFFAGLITSQGGYWWALVDQDEKSAKKAEITNNAPAKGTPPDLVSNKNATNSTRTVKTQ